MDNLFSNHISAIVSKDKGVHTLNCKEYSLEHFKIIDDNCFTGKDYSIIEGENTSSIVIPLKNKKYFLIPSVLTGKSNFLKGCDNNLKINKMDFDVIKHSAPFLPKISGFLSSFSQEEFFEGVMGEVKEKLIFTFLNNWYSIFYNFFVSENEGESVFIGRKGIFKLLCLDNVMRMFLCCENIEDARLFRICRVIVNIYGYDREMVGRLRSLLRDNENLELKKICEELYN